VLQFFCSSFLVVWQFDIVMRSFALWYTVGVLSQWKSDDTQSCWYRVQEWFCPRLGVSNHCPCCCTEV